MDDGLKGMSDEELARRSRAGCSSCFEELVRRYQVPLLRFLLRRMGGRSDAEDVVQEAFVRAYQALPQYRDSSPFRTWLFTIAYRIGVSHGRKQRVRMAAEGNVEEVRRSELPVERLGREEQRRELWGIARSVLSDEQFGAVWLYYVEEMSAGEVSRVLGRSWVAVKTMLHRARKRLMPHVAGLAGVAEYGAGHEVKAGGL